MATFFGPYRVGKPRRVQLARWKLFMRRGRWRQLVGCKEHCEQSSPDWNGWH